MEVEVIQCLQPLYNISNSFYSKNYYQLSYCHYFFTILLFVEVLATGLEPISPPLKRVVILPLDDTSSKTTVQWYKTIAFQFSLLDYLIWCNRQELHLQDYPYCDNHPVNILVLLLVSPLLHILILMHFRIASSKPVNIYSVLYRPPR